MVKLSMIRHSNAHIDETSAPRVAVFVGGTAGIGKLTLDALVRPGTKSKAYVVGRKESEQAFKPFAQSLREANPNADIVWIEGQVTLLSEAKRVCDYIRTLESSIDLLFMTTGYAPFGGRENTTEGLDITHALEFYTRICFTQNLLPLLRASDRARVISVLSGGFESEWLFDVNDLNLEAPGAFGGIATQRHMGIMGTLTLERLAEMPENGGVVFMHTQARVRTGNLYRGLKEGSWGYWLGAGLLDPIVWLLSYSEGEAAERYLYQVTSAAFGGKGVVLERVVGKTTRGEDKGGLFLVHTTCDTVMNEKGLKKLRVNAQEKIWAKMQEIVGPFV